MIDYGLQRSTKRPEEIEILATKVFVTSDIREVIAVVEDQECHEFEFHLLEYSKDEYIKIISEKANELEMGITNTQLALCEIYEQTL